MHTQTLAFDAPVDPVLKEVGRSERVVSIRSLRVAAPFDERSLMYRVDDFSYNADPYAEFLGSPAETLSTPIRRWIAQSGLFQTVVEPGSALRPNSMAEITVLELYGDFRRSSAPAAILTLRFVLLDSPDGIPGKLAFQGEYSRRVLLKGRTPTALMAGWNEALNSILAELGANLRQREAVPAT